MRAASDTAGAFSTSVDAGLAAHGGRTTDVYPTLAQASPDAFAAAVHRLSGTPMAAGDAAVPFILMSVAKPFVLALASDALGVDAVVSLTGMAATGLPFNSPEAITNGPRGRTNPMVNPGAITVASLMGGGDAAAGERAIRDGLSAFAGRELTADAAMVDAIHASNHRNRALATLLHERGLLGGALEDALHLYTYQSCVEVTVRDLARMGAVLAGEGADPDTGATVVSPRAAGLAVEAMALAGMYTATEAWMTAAGLPAKSGIAGGLVMVSPGWGAFAAWSPPLDTEGNPVRAQAAARAFAAALRAGD